MRRLPEPALGGGHLLAGLAMAAISLPGLLGFSMLDRCTRELLVFETEL